MPGAIIGTAAYVFGWMPSMHSSYNGFVSFNPLVWLALSSCIGASEFKGASIHASRTHPSVFASQSQGMAKRVCRSKCLAVALGADVRLALKPLLNNFTHIFLWFFFRIQKAMENVQETPDGETTDPKDLTKEINAMWVRRIGLRQRCVSYNLYALSIRIHVLVDAQANAAVAYTHGAQRLAFNFKQKTYPHIYEAAGKMYVVIEQKYLSWADHVPSHLQPWADQGQSWHGWLPRQLSIEWFHQERSSRRQRNVRPQLCYVQFVWFLIFDNFRFKVLFEKGIRDMIHDDRRYVETFVEHFLQAYDALYYAGEKPKKRTGLASYIWSWFTFDKEEIVQIKYTKLFN